MATQDERRADPVRQGVGLRLKAAREAKGLSQIDVAKHFDIGKGTVSAWETGLGDPGVYRLRELADLYGVSADAILLEDSLTPAAMQIAALLGQLEQARYSDAVLYAEFARSLQSNIHYVQPHARDGSFVNGYWRSNPDGTCLNNLRGCR